MILCNEWNWKYENVEHRNLNFHEKVFLEIYNMWPSCWPAKSVFNQEIAGNSRQYITKGPTFVLEISKFVGNKTFTYNDLSSTISKAKDWMWPMRGL